MNPQPRSHEQIPLFGRSTARTPRPAPLARNSDPISSRIAAAEVTASGRRDSQKRAILAWLRKAREPLTSAEIAREGGFDRYATARRLPDAERDGLVERGPIRDCIITNRPALTWRAKEAV